MRKLEIIQPSSLDSIKDFEDSKWSKIKNSWREPLEKILQAKLKGKEVLKNVPTISG